MDSPNPYAPPRSSLEDFDPGAAELELADRGTRLGANLLDGLISGVPAIGAIWGMLTLLGYSLFSAGAGEPSELLLSLLSFGIAGGFYLAINGYLLARQGQSVGKRLCGLRILRQDGGLPTLWESFGKRYLLILLLGQVPIAGNLVSLVDALFIFRGDRRCLHDLLAGTQVVKVPRRAGAVRPVTVVEASEARPLAPLELCPYCAEPTSEFANVCRSCGRNPFVVDSQAAHRTLSAEELLRKAERLYGHGLGEEALAVHVQATRYHSNRREAWQGLLAAPNAEPAQREEARQHLERLQRILAGV
jgi:uncharacterized RDD family membrane protein YckC